MDWDFEVLDKEQISDVMKLVNEYSMFIGFQRVGIKIFIDSNGKYQMNTSHFYKGKGMAGVYTTSFGNHDTEDEALKFARKQLLSFYDGEGEWKKNEDYNF